MYNNQGCGGYNNIMNNPIVRILQNQGMSLEQIVRFLCQQRGLDVNQLLEQAKSMMNNNPNSR